MKKLFLVFVLLFSISTLTACDFNDIEIVDEQKKDDIKPAVIATVASNTLGSFLKRPTNIYANEAAAESHIPAQEPEVKLPEAHTASIELFEKLDI